jgi:hypothetical protein
VEKVAPGQDFLPVFPISPGNSHFNNIPFSHLSPETSATGPFSTKGYNSRLTARIKEMDLIEKNEYKICSLPLYLKT